MVAGAGLLARYAAWAGRAAEPVLNLALVRSRLPAMELALCATASVATFSVVFLLPVFVQAVQGHSPLATGLAMLPQGIITGLSTTLGQRVLRLISVRTTVLTGFALLTAASFGLLAIGARTSLLVTSALLAGRAVSIGLVISPLLAVLTGSLGPTELNDATTLFNICQRIAGSLGVGLIAAIYASQASTSGAIAALHLTGVVIAAIAAVGLLAAPVLPAERNEFRYSQ